MVRSCTSAVLSLLSKKARSAGWILHLNLISFLWPAPTASPSRLARLIPTNTRKTSPVISEFSRPSVRVSCESVSTSISSGLPTVTLPMSCRSLYLKCRSTCPGVFWPFYKHAHPKGARSRICAASWPTKSGHSAAEPFRSAVLASGRDLSVLGRFDFLSRLVRLDLVRNLRPSPLKRPPHVPARDRSIRPPPFPKRQ